GEVGHAMHEVAIVRETREGGIPLKERTLSRRPSHHSGPLETEPTRRNIPFVKYGGLKFLDPAHVKDMLALLRWAENPRDRVAGFRVLQLLPGIGPGTAGKVLDTMVEAPRPFFALADMATPARTEGWDAFTQVVADLA